MHFTALSLLLFLPHTLATPFAAVSTPIHIPLAASLGTTQNAVARLPRIMDAIRSKYSFESIGEERSYNSIPLTDELNDFGYSAVVGIGTPAQQFNLLLDTGSSDLWVTTDQCTTCSADVPLFNTMQSSTYKNGSALAIQLGSGTLGGYISQDKVTFAGFTMIQQFLSVTTTPNDFPSDGVSGVMGLGFESLSSLHTAPFWQSLGFRNQLASSVFAFYLERHVDQGQQTAPGGTFTLGGTNTDLYTGNIEFIDFPSGTTPGYWFQQLTTVTVQGKSIPIPRDQGLAVIDTGSDLIGVPDNFMRQIWDNVPGAILSNGDYAGLYTLPCSTNVSISLSFGGRDWPINSADVSFPKEDGSDQCLSGMFPFDGAGFGPSWIIGSAFLKNVYSVFRADPPAVGFAQLANGLNA